MPLIDPDAFDPLEGPKLKGAEATLGGTAPLPRPRPLPLIWFKKAPGKKDTS